MTHAPPASGPLPALVAYYRRLEADTAEPVADFGFSVEKIHAQVVLEPDGSLVSLEDIRERKDRGQPRPKSLLVPDGGGRSGTGLKPSFCWDNTGYALGRDTKGNSDRAVAMFRAFREFHLAERSGTNWPTTRVSPPSAGSWKGGTPPRPSRSRAGARSPG